MPILFVCVTCENGPWRAAQFRSCLAKKAATTALVVSLRPWPRRYTTSPWGTQEGHGWGVGERAVLHGEDPEDPHSPAGALPAVRGRGWRRAARVCHGPCAAGAGAAAHRGAQDRVPLRADPRCSGAAGWEPAGRGVPAPRFADRCARGLIFIPSFSQAPGSFGADGGTVGGSADVVSCSSLHGLGAERGHSSSSWSWRSGAVGFFLQGLLHPLTHLALMKFLHGFRTFPHMKKKCEVGSALGVGTECGLYSVHAGGSCGPR